MIDFFIIYECRLLACIITKESDSIANIVHQGKKEEVNMISRFLKKKFQLEAKNYLLEIEVMCKRYIRNVQLILLIKNFLCLI